MLFELHVIFLGRVQGVNFRRTLQGYAREARLWGRVRNCEDGTVELFLQGTKEELETFLQRVKEHPGLATISEMRVDFYPPTQSYEDFKIM